VKPFAIQWYAYLWDAFDFAGQYGVKTMQAVSEYNQNKELAAIEDFIIKEPDAMALGSVSADSSQLAAQKCNEAKIPLFIENSPLPPAWARSSPTWSSTGTSRHHDGRRRRRTGPSPRCSWSPE
jgi:ABC-type sugar transport system substrate-binding protein